MDFFNQITLKFNHKLWLLVKSTPFLKEWKVKHKSPLKNKFLWEPSSEQSLKNISKTFLSSNLLKSLSESMKSSQTVTINSLILQLLSKFIKRFLQTLMIWMKRVSCTFWMPKKLITKLMAKFTRLFSRRFCKKSNQMENLHLMSSLHWDFSMESAIK